MESVIKGLESQGIDATGYIYPGTHHAFFNDSRFEVYDKGAAETAWKRTLDFFRAKLG